MNNERKKIAILGSTGSIGTQALDVISKNSDKFEVTLLTANNNHALLIEQAKLFKAENVVICNEEWYSIVRNELEPLDIKVFAGHKAVCELLSNQEIKIDLVLTAMVGFSGLEPTIAAIKGGRNIALANKETLVAGGFIIKSLLKEHPVSLIPVDSEHSAIFQCLKGETSPIEKILLTASGGPFLWTKKEALEDMPPEEALNHPKWKMGAKVTIDSASMMNKGLEMIEAHWLFDVEPDKIQIVIHPQSIIHSMVQFADGCVIAQMGVTDMRLPILYAFTHPERFEADFGRVDFARLGGFTFLNPDFDKFPCIKIAYTACRKGGNVPCAMNAANEIAVQAYLENRIRFTSIPKLIEKVIEKTGFIAEPQLEDLIQTDQACRETAKELIPKTGNIWM